MARRRRRRSRNTFLPLVFRIVAILLIAGTIYYFTRDHSTQQQIQASVAAKIGEKTDLVSGAAGQTLSDSADVVHSKIATSALLIANRAVGNVKNANVNASGIKTQAQSQFTLPQAGGRAVGSVAASGPSANEIFNSMMGAYANAKTYFDSGKIHLDYRKQGLPKREVMDFSTSWDRASGAFRSELFESKVIADGRLLTCYIYDVDTKNFGRQQLVIPADASNRQPPLGRLLEDDIARSFVSGSQDFPVVNPQRASDAILLPPAFVLISTEVSSPWFGSAGNRVRLKDVRIGGADCFCIESGSQARAKLCIDKSSYLVRQIEYPTSLLDGRLINSPDVKEVKLYATFPAAVTDQSLQNEQFKVQTQPGATTVRRFVELAQTLPSDYLGKTISDLNLVDRNAQPFNSSKLRGKITTIAWIGSELWVPLVDQLSQLKRSGYQNYQFGVAYPQVMLSPGSLDVPRPIDALRAKERLGIPLLLDSGSSSGQQILNEYPALLVFDENAKVQFVSSMKGDQWPQELRVVLDRLGAGEDIAQEMLDGYLTHLSDYDNSLARVSASDWLPSNAVAKASSNPRRAQIRDKEIILTPNKKWSEDSFRLPGNILALPRNAFGPAELAVFDGFQTINFLDGRGKVLERAKLAIPEDQGVSLLRVSGGQSPVFAAFERNGSQVHFFDRNMRLVSSFPSPTEKHDGILDCLPAGDGSFLLSFNDDHGVYKFDPETGNAELYSKTIARNTIVFKGRTVGVTRGEIVDLKSGSILVGNEAGESVSIGRSANAETHLVSTVRTAANKWDAISYSSDYKERWAVPLNSQLFDNEVEPISGVTTAAGETFWAIVDSGDAVCLISDRGTWLGDFEAESPIHGVALSVNGNDVDLVVSTADKVVCWALNYRAN